MKLQLTLIVSLFLLLPVHLFSQACECDQYSVQTIKKTEKLMAAGNFAVALQAIDSLKKSNSPCCRALAFTLEAITLNVKNQYDEAFNSATLALKELGTNSNSYVQTEANRQAGTSCMKRGNPDSASVYYFTALEFAMKAGEHDLESRTLTSIAGLYSQRKQEQKALEYQKKSVTAAQKSGDTLMLAQAYANLATFYGAVYDDTENELYVDSAVQVQTIAGPFIKAAGTRNLLLRHYLTLEKFDIVKKQFLSGLRYSDTLTGLLNEKTNPNFRQSYYIDRGVLLTGLNRFDEAIENLEAAHEIIQQLNNPFQLRMINDRLYEVYKAKKDPVTALAYLEKYRVLNDSLVDSENTEAINELEVKFNKAQDQQTIQRLSYQKKIWALLALAGVLALAGLILIIRQQSLRNKKKILETEQRLNRARMNPHFFFNALSSLQSFAMEGQDGKSIASNISKFSHIMRETLESTYKEYVTIEQEKEFLQEYLELQKIRYAEKFSFTITIDDSIDPDSILIPSMILQPFTENSIEHGFAGIDYPGQLAVNFEKTGQEIKISITDNGKGLASGPADNSTHISRASQIIKDRIYLLNIKLKTKASFKIENNQNGKGVLVEIRLPLIMR